MIASDVAIYPAAGMADYTAAKSALIGFAKALALELAATGVTVNAVCPGAIDTAAVAALPEPVISAIRASIPMGRLGRPEEVAGLVAYLVRPEAGYITGQAISINGGRSMS
jgi:NAD(P)-dependent dehydrogenase (short-subunit alcohol dehydrogenase family)